MPLAGGAPHRGTLLEPVAPEAVREHGEAYQKVLEIDKSFAPAANNLAWNYAESNSNLDTAFNLAQKARDLRPNDPAIADTLGPALEGMREVLEPAVSA